MAAMCSEDEYKRFLEGLEKRSMSGKTEVKPIVWQGQDIVQKRATEMRDAWDEWLERPDEFPTLDLLNAMGEMIEACGVDPIKTEHCVHVWETFEDGSTRCFDCDKVRDE